MSKDSIWTHQISFNPFSAAYIGQGHRQSGKSWVYYGFGKIQSYFTTIQKMFSFLSNDEQKCVVTFLAVAPQIDT